MEIEKYRVVKGTPFTCTSMGPEKKTGCFNWKDDRDGFFKAYVKDYNNGEELFISERPHVKITRLFLDIEGLKNGQTELDLIINEFIELIINHFIFSYRKEIELKKTSIKYDILFNSKDETKCHVHFFYAKEILENNEEVIIYPCIHTEYPLLKKVFKILKNKGFPVDESASSLRLIGSLKKEGKEKGVYYPIEGGITVENLKKYCITADIGDLQINLNEPEDPLFYDPPYKPNLEKNYSTKIPKEFDFENFVSKIPLPSDWESWNKILFFSEICGVDSSIMEFWSSQDISKYKPGESTQIMEKVSNTDREKYKDSAFGFLINKLKKGVSKSEYLEWRKDNFKSKQFGMYDLKSDYIIGDYNRKMTGRIFESSDEAYEFMVKELSKCIRIIKKGTPCVVYKDDSTPLRVQKWSDFKRENKDCEVKYKIDGKIINKPISGYLPLIKDKRFVYRGMGFYPGGNLPENYFNTFLGFEFEKYPETKDLSENSKMILNLIYEVWCDSDKEKYEWTLNWLSHTLQYPETKTGVALVLNSDQGCGKGSVLDFFRNYIYGKGLFEKANDLSRVTKNFNGDLCERIMYWIDEISISGNWHVSWDTLKSYITDETIKIEKKYKDQETVENYLNIVLTTNNISSLKIEQSDRRYTIFRCSDKYCKDYDMWTKFHKTVKFNGQQMGTEIGNYLMNRDCVKPIMLETEEHEDLLEESKPQIEIFVDQIRSGELKDSSGNLWNDDLEFKAKDLFDIYTDWVSENCYERKFSSTMFGRKLKNVKGVICKKTSKCNIYYL